MSRQRHIWDGRNSNSRCERCSLRREIVRMSRGGPGWRYWHPYWRGAIGLHAWDRKGVPECRPGLYAKTNDIGKV